MMQRRSEPRKILEVIGGFQDGDTFPSWDDIALDGAEIQMCYEDWFICYRLEDEKLIFRGCEPL
jgi:hypothetical protein